MKTHVFLPAIASGALLWAAFFPLDLGMLGFVALVPWLTLVRAPVSNRRRYFAAYLGGVVFFTLATNWVRVAHPNMFMSWFGLAVVMPVFWLAALAIIRSLDRVGAPMALSVPVAWVAMEYFRMHFPTGFPFMKQIGAYQMIGFGWYYLGYTQHSFLQLIQIADFGGVYVVSFVVGAVNGALAEWIRRPTPEGTAAASPAPQVKAARIGGLVFALALVGTSIGYGYWRFDHPAFTDGPLVAAIQGNVSQGDKMGDTAKLVSSYSQLHMTAFTEKPRPDLIIWPETCCPVDWCSVAPGAKGKDAPDEFQRWRLISRKEFLERDWNTPVLFGLNGLEWDGARVWKYNSAFMVKPAPKPEGWLPGDPVLFPSAPVDRYDKMHLVPFGEYVPLGEQLPFMAWFTPYKKGYECRPGEKWTRFPLTTRDGRPFTFGCLICYEDSDPYLARQYVASEPVDFLVNISNDGWFDGTEEHEQHLAICRFRAIEARRAVVRSVNMGISGLIDADGRVVTLPRQLIRDSNDKITLKEKPQGEWSEAKKIDGVVTATVPIDTRRPLYASLGDWVPAGCWLIALVGVVASLVNPARKGGG